MKTEAELVVELAQAKQTITDLAMIVCRLLTKPLTEKRKAEIWDYLKRQGLEGNILRS